MQTRRDQLHAYRFLTKRALAALVTGQPNAVEPPLRRLTLTTISGVMIAVLVGVGFLLVGYLKPSAGDAWKEGGTIIVDNDSGARYVYIDGKLDPVLNWTSGVLAVASGNSQGAVDVTHVDPEDISGTTLGPTIGIPNLPDTLPAADHALSGPFVSCSQLQVRSSTSVQALVSLQVGDTDLTAAPIAAQDAVLVTTRSSGAQYLVYQGQRLGIASSEIAVVIGTQDVSPLTVGTAFLQSLPAGPTLRTPKIADFGRRGPSVGGTPTRVGQVVDATDAHRNFLALAGGLAPLTSLQAALVGTVTGTGGDHLPQLRTDLGSALDAHQQELPADIHDQFPESLPSEVPTLDPDPAAQGGLCARFHSGAGDTADLLLPRPLSGSPNPGAGIVESAASQRGQADEVVVAPGHVALVRATDSPTVFLLTATGRRYAFADRGLTAALGYGSVTPTAIPPAVLALIDSGPTLDPAAARRTTS